MKRTTILSLAFAGMAACVTPGCPSASAVERDPAVRSGRLPNGLTYYIRHNETPANSVDFFIAQRAGSVNEEENQRGLAHFLEHMCFNGTEHFPGNSLISWLESVGVRFGANLNAYTSTDETVYNISKVPAARPSTLDSCVMILSDWSHRLLLRPEDIDAERGVIVNEWRQRSSATNRMLERALPRIYPGSRYGDRMPIGLMSVVENFPPEALKDYYDKWYYPANQAVIIVGDIDPDFAEESVKRHFRDIATPENAADVPVYDVPDNEKLIVVTEKDPEQHVGMVQLHFKHRPSENNGAVEDEVTASLIGSMIAARFDSLERQADCPHTYLGIGDTKFMMSRPMRSFLLRGVVKPGRAADAVEAWTLEMRRALLSGFTDQELEMAKKEYAAGLDASAKKSPKTGNTEYARMYARNFIDGDEPVAIADRIDAEREALGKITVADADVWLRNNISLTGRNAVIISYRPDDESTPDVTAESLEAAFLRAAAAHPEAYAAPEMVTVLLDREPTAGFIVSTDSLQQFGVKVYGLSNGIRVLARYSAAVPDQVYVRGVGPGGLSQEYTPELGATMKLLDEGMDVSAFGSFSANDLKRYLTGRNIRVSASVSNTEESVEAATGRDDMRDAFRLMYLKVTDPRRDDDAYRIYAEQKRNGLRNKFANPTQVMGDSIHRNVYSRHPLGAKETSETVDKADYAAMVGIYKRRFKDMADFTFYVAGDFDEDSLKACLESYVASLPAAGRIERPRDIGYRFTPGSRDVVFTRGMTTPQSVVYAFFTAPAEYDLGEVLKASVLGRVLQMRLLADLREAKGWTYSVRGHCAINAGMNGDDPSCLLMPVYIKLEPGHEDECAAIVRSTIEDIAANGVNADELDKVREYLAKSYAEAADDNAYWLIVMKSFVKFGRDMHNGYGELLSSLTSADIAAFARQALSGDCTRVIMKGIPAEK